MLSPSTVERLKSRVKIATRTANPVMETADFPGLLLRYANDERKEERRPLLKKQEDSKKLHQEDQRAGQESGPD